MLLLVNLVLILQLRLATARAGPVAVTIPGEFVIPAVGLPLILTVQSGTREWNRFIGDPVPDTLTGPQRTPHPIHLSPRLLVLYIDLLIIRQLSFSASTASWKHLSRALTLAINRSHF